MGRAIVREPSVFLMDEPLSNLDAKLRVQMRADIAALQSRLGVTMVYVTHDQSEAMTLGHRVAVLKDGRLQQCDAPRTLYERPANTFVAGFIGSPAMNLCELPLGANGSVPFGGESVALPASAAGAGWGRIVLGLRPESLELAGEGCRRASRWSRRSAPTPTSSASPRSPARRSSSSRAARPGSAPSGTRASTCARGRTRRTSSIRRPARGSPELMSGEVFLAEIREQPAALLRLLAHEQEFAAVAEALARRAPSVVRLVGHGTSDNAASYGVYAFGLLPGWTALRDSISLTVYYDAAIDFASSAVVALSQSGRTPDVVEYVQRARADGALTIALTNDPASELGQAAELVLPLAAGPEQAVAATKTYLNELAALAAAGGRRGRPRAGDGRRDSAASPASSTSACPTSSRPPRRSRPRSRSSGGCS